MNGKLECPLYRYGVHKRSSWQPHLVTAVYRRCSHFPCSSFCLKVNCCFLASSVCFHWLLILNSTSLKCKLLNQLLSPPQLCVLALIYNIPRLFHSTDSTDFLLCADCRPGTRVHTMQPNRSAYISLHPSLKTYSLVCYSLSPLHTPAS